MSKVGRITRIGASAIVLAAACCCAQACAGESAERAPSGQGGDSSAGGAAGAAISFQGSAGGGGDEKCYGGLQCAAGETCVIGRCLVPNECRKSRVSCTDREPTCPSGQTPAVLDGCWSDCVPIDTCDSLDDCSICQRDGQVCVRWASELEDFHGCMKWPSSCEGVLTCECAAEQACGLRSCSRIDGDRITCVGNLN